MSEMDEVRHLGGGRKGLFLLLRYVFIISASYLLIFHIPGTKLGPTQALMIAVALASNVFLSRVSVGTLFSWYVEAPVLIADTLWVSWALHSTGAIGQEFFLLYFLVLFLAATGNNLFMILLGAVLISAANVYFLSPGAFWTSPEHLLRVVFFFAVALFYSHVLREIRSERQRADKGFAWARELEVKVAERTAHLQQLYDHARAASGAKSEFVANISHELRTPVNIIMGYTEMLLDKRLSLRDPERESLVRSARNAAGTLLQLVNSVLDLGKLEAGRMPVEVHPIVLDRLITELKQRSRIPTAPNVELHWQIGESLPVIESDADKLMIVLDNLINNASKFTTEGTITVRLRDLPETAQIECRVDDTGPGIDPEQLPLIFQPFHQVDGSSTRRYDGVGLGLAIVDSYMRLLGGDIRVESQRGVGSSFIVRLPHRLAGRTRDAETRTAAVLPPPASDQLRDDTPERLAG
jgi:signal transduction histidine kinase